MLNPTLGSTGGSGSGPDPDPGIVDQDIDIYVGNPGVESFAAARAEAMTYRGRMAFGRTVNIRLPQGIVPCTAADVTFEGIDFPELIVRGTAPWMITQAQSVSVAAAGDGYDITYDFGFDGGFAVGDVIVAYCEMISPPAVHPLRVLSAVSGCHEVVEPTATGVRVHVVGPSPALASVAGLTIPVADLGAAMGLYVKSMPTVLEVDGSNALTISQSDIGGIADVAIRVVFTGWSSGIIIDRSTFGLNRFVHGTAILALLPSSGIDGYGGALTGDELNVRLPTLICQPHHSGSQYISVMNSDFKVAGLYASNASFSSTIGRSRIEISAGLITGGINLEGTVDFMGNRMMLWIAPYTPPTGFDLLVQASRGARCWLSDPYFLDSQVVTVSPTSGVPGNDGAEIYLTMF